MKWKNPKGCYGYLDRQRKLEILKTVVMFGISLALYAAGYITTKTNKNLLTLVAVLGCLPASKSAVSMIMFLRAKGCSAALKEKIEEHAKGLSQRFDLYLTSYAKNFQISHAVMKGRSLIGITEDSTFDENACGEHLKSMFAKNGFKNITVKIFKSESDYLERLDSLRASEIEDNAEFNEKVLSLLEDISL